MLALAAILFAPVATVRAQGNPPLKLVQKISLPGVRGRLDHLAVDVKGMRLFVPANDENQNTIEVIDLRTGQRIARIPGLSHPQGTYYSATLDRLFVTNGDDGTCKIFLGDTLELLKNLPLGPAGTNANQVGYDPDTKLLYVGLGDKNSGALAIVDTSSNQRIGEIKTDARPGWITFEKSGPRIFSNLSGSPKLAIYDKTKRQVIATWPVTAAKNNGPMAMDDSHHRLFLATREPPLLIVYDSDSGKQVTQLDSVPGIDGLWYDAARKRIYATGNGAIAVYDQRSADDYSPMVKIPMETNAQPSLWVPEFSRLYVSIPQDGDRDAEVLVYEP
jgi:DNA-binding beta-propeller fold protein YncE